MRYLEAGGSHTTFMRMLRLVSIGRVDVRLLVNLSLAVDHGMDSLVDADLKLHNV